MRVPCRTALTDVGATSVGVPAGWLHAAAIRSEYGATLHLFTDPAGDGVFLVATPREDVRQDSSDSEVIQLDRREFLALGVLLDRKSATPVYADTRDVNRSIEGTGGMSSVLQRRPGGRPRRSRSEARRLLLRRAIRLRETLDPLEPLRIVDLAAAKPRRSEDTISDLFTRAEWTPDDLEVEMGAPEAAKTGANRKNP